MMTKKEFKILEYRVDKIACGMRLIRLPAECSSTIATFNPSTRQT